MAPSHAGQMARAAAAARRRPVLTIALAILMLASAATLWSFQPAPLAAPAPWSGPLPAASPPPQLAIYQLPTGVYRTKAALAFRGGSFSEDRSFVATAILVRHPRGDLLFDAGLGRDVDAHVAAQPKLARAPFELRQTVRSQLDAAHYDFRQLRGVVPTHLHWDHVSGLGELPVPIWMNAAERRYSTEDRDDTRVFRTVSAGRAIHEYGFTGPPYLGFPASYDVWGDGSVVLVPAPGHTPGSIVAFITLSGGQRYALIGDLSWQLDGIEARAERPWLLRALADVDAAQVRENLRRVIALRGRFHVVPAHDGRAYEGIPVWR